ncbi:dethiobiotin synthase [Microbulbifer bruguierae]|uniref:ATP-dependent dethiobiotin synthetase BioD n=1 Tax=Microbulbifer bruguierae TaxID=3029061 RepID=A0ABY8N8X8_9GAMM|nr:dethiobiotin synthase [Microbulbifer bruguierae]WGL15057.1 dethiobiotin synthase [Microbulbifer bruguierae]
MTRTFFVTGTNTEVGKTYVSAALLKAAGDSGLNTAAVKPVASGCEQTEDGLRNVDALTLMDAMTQELPYQQVNPIALEPAIAPHIAAMEVGRRLDPSRLVGICRGVMSGGADFVLVEGAGGWRVPLAPRQFLSDLPRELELPVILVVGMELGCINHALLTAEAIRRDGLPLAGWVANFIRGPQAQMPRAEENLMTLRTLLPAPCLGVIPFDDSGDYRNGAAHLDPSPLLSSSD